MQKAEEILHLNKTFCCLDTKQKKGHYNIAIFLQVTVEWPQSGGKKVFNYGQIKLIVSFAGERNFVLFESELEVEKTVYLGEKTSI